MYNANISYWNFKMKLKTETKQTKPKFHFESGFSETFSLVKYQNINLNLTHNSSRSVQNVRRIQ